MFGRGFWIILILLTATMARASSSGVSYQGRILKPDGTPLSGHHTQFKLQLRTPDASNCLFYEELQEQDMSSSSGQFAITINDGTGTRLDSTGYGLDRIFSNQGSFTFNPATCSSGSSYIPNENDGRNLVVYFKDETMASWEPIPAAKINFVPFAFEAKRVQGYTADSLLRVVNGSGDPLTGISPLSNAQYTELMALIGGTSTQYTKSGQINGSAAPTMTSGQVLGWNGTAWTSVDPLASVQPFAKVALPTCAAGEFIKDNGANGFVCATPANSGGTVTQVNTGTGLTGGGFTTSGTISIANQGIDTAQIKDGAVTAVKLAADSVDSSKIVDGSITGADLSSSINITTSGTIATGSTTTRDFKLYPSSGSNKITFAAPLSLAADYSLTWPTSAGGSNQVLTTDGAGNLTWTTPAGTGLTALTGDVSASGSGSVAATVNAVGGSTAANVHSAELLANAATNANTASTIVKRDASGNFSAGAVTTTSVQADTLKLNNSGSVLNIVNPVGGAWTMTLPSSAGSAGQVMQSNGSGTMSWITPLTSSTGFVNGGNSFGAIANLGTNDNYDLNIRTNGVTKATVTAAGDVGVGTTAPTAKLEIVNPATNGLSLKVSSVDPAIYGGAAQIYAKVNTTDATTGGPSNGLYTEVSVNGSASLSHDLASIDAEAYGETSGSVSSLSGIITYVENDGPGTVASASGLHVYTNWHGAPVTTNYGILIDDQSISNGTKNYNLYSGGAGLNYFGGKVGIGTTSPGAALDVAGAIKVAGTGAETCDATHYVGGIRYNAGNLQYCNGTSWTTLGVAGSGITALTGDVTASGTGSVAATVASVGGSTAANVHSAELLANAATNANTASAIVKRDASGNFAASAVTETSTIYKDSGSNTVTVSAPTAVTTSYALKLPTAVAASSGQVLASDTSGNLSWSTLPTSLPPSGSAGGDLSGTYPNPSVATVGTSTAANVHSAELLANAAASANTASTIVKRDASGNFTAGSITTTSTQADTLKLNNAGSILNIVNPVGGAWTMTLPATAGSNGQVMQTNGSGTMSWVTPLTSSTGFVNGGNSFGAASSLGNNDNFDLNIKTNNQSRMTITAAGNVGIGTTSPSFGVDVRKTQTSTDTSNGVLYIAADGWGTPHTAEASNFTKLTVSPSAAETAWVERSAIFGWADQPSTNTYTGRFQSGVTGVSTVRNTTGTASSIWANGVEGHVFKDSDASEVHGVHGIIDSTGGQGGLIALYGETTQSGGNASANVGVASYPVAKGGTTGTLTGIDVSPSIQGGTVTDYYGIYLRDPLYSGSTVNRYALYIANPNGTPSGNDYAIYNASTKSNYFAGNIGIGVASPSAKLTIAAGTASAGTAPLKFTSGTLMTTPEDGAMEYNSSSGLWFTIGSTRYVIPTNTAAGNYSNVSTISNAGGSITMTPSAGNSVIVNQSTVSTSSSTGALIVNGGVGVAGAINTAGNITSGGSITATTNAVIPQIYGSTAASGNIKIDGTSNASVGNVLLASAGGNVGIGTTSPSTALHVIGFGTFTGGLTVGNDFVLTKDNSALNGFAYPLAKIYRPSGYNNGVQIGYWSNGTNDTAGAIGSIASGGDLIFSTNVSGTNVDRIHIANAGNVGIGTTSPSAMLNVLGSARIGKNSNQATQMSWGDPYTLGAMSVDDSTTTVADWSNPYNSIYKSFQVAPSAASANSWYAHDMSDIVVPASNANEIGEVDGADIYLTNKGTGTVDGMYGLDASVQNSGTGTLSYGNAVEGAVFNTSTGTMNYGEGGWFGVINGGGGALNTAQGVYTTTDNQSSGTMNEADGVYARILNRSTGTVSNAYGVNAYLTNLSSGNMTNQTGVASLLHNAGTGTITNSTGMTTYIANWGNGTMTNATGVSGGVENDGTGTMTTAKGATFGVSQGSSVNMTTATGMSSTIHTASSGNITDALAVDTNVYLGGGTANITNVYGVRSQITFGGGSGTMTNVYGLYSYPQTGTNVYGLYIPGVGGTNPYGVYVANETNNYFSGKVGIGTTAPQATLDINGYARLKANASAPVACSASNDNALASTSHHTLCMCNGSTTTWVSTTDGTTACTW